MINIVFQTTFQELHTAVNKETFDPISKPDLSWLQRTMNDLLVQLEFNSIAKVAAKDMEKDTIIRVWGHVDRVFDSLKMDTTR